MALSDQQAYALNNKKNNKNNNEDNNNNNNNEPEDIPIVEIEEEPCKEPNPERQHMQELILETREKILELIERDPSKYNSDDVELARTDDWQVERFLKKKKNNVDDAVKMIDDTMQWRHQLDMPNRKDEEFPIEFFKVGAIFGYEPDREGNGVVYMRVRMHRRINEIDQIERLFILHTINKMDKQTNGKGMVIVFDCKGVGVSNIDMEMMLFLINSLIKYYPDGLRNILVYEMPWLLTQTWRIIHNLLPAEYRNKIKMVDKKSILNHIDSANLPLYIGGQCLRNYHHVPEGCRTAEECGRDIGLTEKQIQRIFQLFRPFLEEAEEETKLLVERTEALNHINNNNDDVAV